MNAEQSPSIGRAPRHRNVIYDDIAIAAMLAYERHDFAEGDRLGELLCKISEQIRLTRIANRAFRR